VCKSITKVVNKLSPDATAFPNLYEKVFAGSSKMIFCAQAKGLYPGGGTTRKSKSRLVKNILLSVVVETLM